MLFRLLGPLEVSEDGEPITVPSGKCAALLTALLLRPNRVVSSDELTEALWGDRPPPRARNAVQVHVSTLRKALGSGRVESVGDGYRIRIDAGELDMERFEDLANGGSAALARGQLTEALTLFNQALMWWRGPALGGVIGTDFAAPTAARLEERRAVAVDQRTDVLLALGRHDELVAELEVLAAAEPLRERRRAQLALALYRTGQQAAALRAIDVFRRQLRDELGLDPGTAIAALEVAILNQSDEISWAEPEAGDQRTVETNLPVPTNAFVDRDAEQVEVRGAVRRHRLVTLVGPGGVGKTRLAIELAWEMVRTRAAAAWLVDLGGSGTDDEVEAELASVFAVSEASGQNVIDGMVERLGQARALLILDGCDHAAAAVGRVVNAVLDRCPGVTVLATTRRRLRVPNELSWTMQPLERAAAVELFAARASEADPTLVIDQRAQNDLDRICEQLDDLPLAIELAAARVPYIALDDLCSRLSDRFSLLRDRKRAVDRHRTLDALIEWSHELLSEQEQTLFRRLSIFEGGATLPAIEAVCAAASLPRPSILDLLVALTDASLVVVQRVSGAPRYKMLDTVGEFARARCADADERDTLARAHSAHFLAVAEQGSARVDTAEEAVTFAGFAADRANLVAAIAEAHTTDPGVALRIVRALWPWWSTIGNCREGVALADAALGVALQNDPSRPRVMIGAARLVEQLGEFDDAVARYEDGIAAARRVGDDASASLGLGYLGHLTFRRGEPSRAEALHAESRALAEASGDERVLLRALINAANVDANADRAEAALRGYAPALALARKLGARVPEGTILGNMASMTWRTNYPAGRDLYLDALAIHESAQDLRGAAIVLMNVSLAARSNDKLDESRTYVERALAYAVDVGDRWLQARATMELATTLRWLDDLDGSETRLREVLPVALELGDPETEAIVVSSLAQVAALRGDYTGAREQYAVAIEIAERIGDAFIKGACVASLGEMARDEGQPDEARRYFVEARTLYESAERRDRVAMVDEMLAAL